MFKRFYPWLILSFFISDLLCAAWSSGGGEIVKEGHNPWFIQNTKSVRYCIEINPEQVNLSAEVIDQQIQRALTYWQDEFKHSQNQFFDIQVATQEFILDTCDKNSPVDITFQFGVLSKKQRQYLRDPKRFPAITVQTNYDREEMRGRGFIYFAPESGDDALEDESLISHPWSRHKNILYWTLVHELGHVFGLAHSASNPARFHPMSHLFVEYILKKENQSSIGLWQPRSFFRIRIKENQSPQFICRDQVSVAMQFFGIPSHLRCIGIVLKENGIQVLAADSFTSSSILIGTITFLKHSPSIKPAMTISLPAEQNVIGDKPYLTVPSYFIDGYSGIFQSNLTRLSHPVGISIDPTTDFPLDLNLKISGLNQGRFFMDILNVNQ